MPGWEPRLPPALRAPLATPAREAFESLPHGSRDELRDLLSAEAPTRVRALTAGRLAVTNGGAPTGIHVPVLAYLVQSPGGQMAVDTGLGARWRRSPGAGEGAGTGRYLPELSGPTFHEQLGDLGLRPVRLVCTHLHLDHAGGARELALPLEASESELATLAAGAPGYPAEDLEDIPKVAIRLDPSLPVGPFTASAVLAPGVMALDTAGHTAGSISLLLCLGPMWGLICGDAVYPRLEEPDSAAFLGALRIRRLVEDVPGIVLLPAHDTTVQRACADGSWFGVPWPPVD